MDAYKRARCTESGDYVPMSGPSLMGGSRASRDHWQRGSTTKAELCRCFADRTAGCRDWSFVGGGDRYAPGDREGRNLVSRGPPYSVDKHSTTPSDTECLNRKYAKNAHSEGFLHKMACDAVRRQSYVSVGALCGSRFKGGLLRRQRDPLFIFTAVSEIPSSRLFHLGA